ncbi:MAG: hypothetical protein QM811_18940 [Pirellulales bacterium]
MTPDEFNVKIWQTKQGGNTVYTCPSIKDITSTEAMQAYSNTAYTAQFGHFPPPLTNDPADISNEKVNPDLPLKVTVFKNSSKKVFAIDAKAAGQSNLRTRWFCNPQYDPMGLIDFRHYKKANILFIDGHVNSFASSALPKDSNVSAFTLITGSKYSVGDLWLKPDAPPSSEAN